MKKKVNTSHREKSKYKLQGDDLKCFFFCFFKINFRYDVDSKSPDLSKHVSTTEIVEI